MLIVFEGLDQSGKETQARMLRERLAQEGRAVRALSFPEYETPIGREIRHALNGQREFPADVMQLLYVANRLEFRPQMEQWLAAGDIVVCDRYCASTIAYGEAQGLDVAWLTEIQRPLPPPQVTVLLDIAPDVAARRKAVNRDRYESDLGLLARVRDSYTRQAAAAGWCVVDANAAREVVEVAVAAGVRQIMQGVGGR
ncbi:MAG TPA: dTMP kinase [Vicinamibacterales bacterium]|nr:dTMP kinase [Vicinamibacterales bacterium]